MAHRPLPREMVVYVTTDRNLPEAMAKVHVGRLGRFVHGDDIPRAALEVRESWWRVRRLNGGRFEFLEQVDEPVHAPPTGGQRQTPPSAYGRKSIEWAGVGFVAIGLHDGGMYRGWPGLFGLVRREITGGLTLLFVDAAEDLANAAGPGHPVWSDATSAGATELHVVIVEGPRVDRLGLVSRIVRHLRPPLNQAAPTEEPSQSLEGKTTGRLGGFGT